MFTASMVRYPWEPGTRFSAFHECRRSYLAHDPEGGWEDLFLFAVQRLDRAVARTDHGYRIDICVGDVKGDRVVPGEAFLCTVPRIVTGTLSPEPISPATIGMVFRVTGASPAAGRTVTTSAGCWDHTSRSEARGGLECRNPSLVCQENRYLERVAREIPGFSRRRGNELG